MSDVKTILAEGINKMASDVHINVGMPPIFRKNTELFEMDFPVISSEDAKEMVLDMIGPDRFKIFEEKTDIDFSTTIEDGHRFRVNAHYQRDTIAIAFRVIPSQIPSIDDLNLPPIAKGLTDLPRGLVLVTGHTGSGKSTTLAGMIGVINKKYKKRVITLEDPIEYLLENEMSMIEQREIGSDCIGFASGLRHVLRQDPDVIMVGEVRDVETARMAIQSSLTGHLVFSTLHTNDSAGAVSRLLDLGVEPYLVSSSLIAIMAQRLVRKVCPNCKKEYEPTARELRELGIDDNTAQQSGRFFVGAGCEKCFKTGYRGRTGIYELMLIGEQIQELIYKRQSAGTVKKAALNAGLKTLRMDGARKVLAGVTSIAEVLRVTQADVM